MLRYNAEIHEEAELGGHAPGEGGPALVELNAQEDGMTALMYAAKRAHNGMVQSLIQAKADAELVNHAGMTASEIASYYGNQSTKYLLDRILEGVLGDEGDDVSTGAKGIIV